MYYIRSMITFSLVCFRTLKMNCNRFSFIYTKNVKKMKKKTFRINLFSTNLKCPKCGFLVKHKESRFILKNIYACIKNTMDSILVHKDLQMHSKLKKICDELPQLNYLKYKNFTPWMIGCKWWKRRQKVEASSWITIHNQLLSWCLLVQELLWYDFLRSPFSFYIVKNHFIRHSSASLFQCTTVSWNAHVSYFVLILHIIRIL